MLPFTDNASVPSKTAVVSFQAGSDGYSFVTEGTSVCHVASIALERFNSDWWKGPRPTPETVLYVSPVGHAANVHLDLTVSNFGIQEAREFTQAEQDVFPGCPELKDGYYWANDKPGLGIDLDEKLAARYPIKDDPPFDMFWGNVRKRDGSIVKP